MAEAKNKIQISKLLAEDFVRSEYKATVKEFQKIIPTSKPDVFKVELKVVFQGWLNNSWTVEDHHIIVYVSTKTEEILGFEKDPEKEAKHEKTTSSSSDDEDEEEEGEGYVDEMPYDPVFEEPRPKYDFSDQLNQDKVNRLAREGKLTPSEALKFKESIGRDRGDFTRQMDWGRHLDSYD